LCVRPSKDTTHSIVEPTRRAAQIRRPLLLFRILPELHARRIRSRFFLTDFGIVEISKHIKPEETESMKKLAPLVAAASLTATAVHAQSTVTLYGIIDEGFNYTSNAGGKPLYNLSSGVMAGSRWGLRGTEDLGGGLKAIFTLENGFDINTGGFKQGGAEFGRQAYVGLASPYGTLTLGRQYDLVTEYVDVFEAGSQWGGYIAAHPGDIDNLNNSNRVNNAVKYTSAGYRGLVFGAFYSFGGVAGDFSRNQLYSFGAGYNNGPLSLGAGYLYARDPNQSYFGTTPSSSAVNNNLTATPVYSGYASATGEQLVAAGGAYTIGAATLGATYSYIQFRGLGGNPVGGAGPTNSYRGSAHFNNAEVNFKYRVAPELVLGIAYDFTKGNGAGDNGSATYHQGSVGADYFLSKRTDVYLVGVIQHASGTDSTGKQAVASINALTPSTSNQQTTVRLGLRHKF
jgi:predicted porin